MSYRLLLFVLEFSAAAVFMTDALMEAWQRDSIAVLAASASALFFMSAGIDLKRIVVGWGRG